MPFLSSKSLTDFGFYEFKHLVNVYIMFEVYKTLSGKGCNRRSGVHVDILCIAFAFYKKWGTYFKLPMIFLETQIFVNWLMFRSTFLWHKSLACCVECLIPLRLFVAFRQARNFIVLSKDSKTRKYQIFNFLCVCYTMTSMFFYIFLFFKKLYVVEMVIIDKTICNIQL